MKIVVKFPIENNYIGKINNITNFHYDLTMLIAIKKRFGICALGHDSGKGCQMWFESSKRPGNMNLFQFFENYNSQDHEDDVNS